MSPADKDLSITVRATVRTTVTISSFRSPRDAFDRAELERDAYVWAIAQANRIRRTAFARLGKRHRRPFSQAIRAAAIEAGRAAAREIRMTDGR